MPRQANVAEEITTRTHTNRRIKAHSAFCHLNTRGCVFESRLGLSIPFFLRVLQCFPNFPTRGPVLPSKNNQGSLRPYSSKYRLSG